MARPSLTTPEDALAAIQLLNQQWNRGATIAEITKMVFPEAKFGKKGPTQNDREYKAVYHQIITYLVEKVTKNPHKRGACATYSAVVTVDPPKEEAPMWSCRPQPGTSHIE